MKATHLITLSAYIDDQSVQDQSTIQFKCNVQNYNESLKQPVTLAHFVACDANGVPLEELPEVIHSKEQLALKYQYVRSQKSVIFEGWEVIQSNKIHHHNVFNSELGLQIEFYKEKESLIRIWDTIGDIELTIIQSLADLAESTTENPLKLK